MGISNTSMNPVIGTKANWYEIKILPIHRSPVLPFILEIMDCLTTGHVSQLDNLPYLII